jgi:hypothetical protein
MAYYPTMPPGGQVPPQPRRGMPTYAKVLIGCGVLFVLGAGAAIFLGVRLLTRTMGNMMGGGPLAPTTQPGAALFTEQWRQALPQAAGPGGGPPPAAMSMFGFPSSIATYDLDGEGGDEILFGDTYGNAIVFRGDGSQMLSLNTGQPSVLCGGRIDGEPKVFATSLFGGGSVRAYGLDGVLVWTYLSSAPMPSLPGAPSTGPGGTATPPPMPPTYGYGMGGGCMHILDVNGDGKDEVLIGYDGPPGLECVTADDKQNVLWQYGATGGVSDVTSGDVDGDGKVEVLVADPMGAIVVLDRKGAFKAKWSPNAWAPGSATGLLVADLDGDGTAEVLFAAATMPAPNAAAQVTVSGLKPNGTAAWSQQVAGGGMMSMMMQTTPMAAADLKGDGTKMWVVAGGDGSLNVIPKSGAPMKTHNTGVRIRSIAALKRAGEKAQWIVVSTGEDVIAYKPVEGTF